MSDQATLFQDGELAEAPEKLCTDALAIWNEIAPKATWPEARFLTQSRRTAMRRALKDYGGLLGWREHLARAASSDFLTGKSWRDERHKNWRPDLDWFLKPANVVKILENKFGGTTAPKPSVFGKEKAKGGIDWRGTLERYRVRGFWHKDSMGPRPEEPGPHKAPADMIEAWRKKHGVTGVPATRANETREERLTGMILAYRKVGKYSDANRLEEELAKIEGRPPVLVPAPDVAHVGMPDKEPAPVRPPPYRPGPRRSEAEITRAMAMAEDVPYEMIPEGDDYGDGA